jgi:hypothetical protein
LQRPLHPQSPVHLQPYPIHFPDTHPHRITILSSSPQWNVDPHSLSQPILRTPGSMRS